MTKEQKKIRDEKIDEMVETLADLRIKSDWEILHGEFDIYDVGKKHIKIYRNLSKITQKEIDCVKGTIHYLLENCTMNRRDLLNRIKYMEKKTDLDYEKRDLNRKLRQAYSCVLVYGK